MRKHHDWQAKNHRYLARLVQREAAKKSKNSEDWSNYSDAVYAHYAAAYAHEDAHWHAGNSSMKHYNAWAKNAEYHSKEAFREHNKVSSHKLGDKGNANTIT